MRFSLFTQRIPAVLTLFLAVLPALRSQEVHLPGLEPLVPRFYAQTERYSAGWDGERSCAPMVYGSSGCSALLRPFGGTAGGALEQLCALCERFFEFNGGAEYLRRFYTALEKQRREPAADAETAEKGAGETAGIEKLPEEEIAELMREWKREHSEPPPELKAAVPRDMRAELGRRFAEAAESAAKRLKMEMEALYRRERALYLSSRRLPEEGENTAAAPALAEQAAEEALHHAGESGNEKYGGNGSRPGSPEVPRGPSLPDTRGAESMETYRRELRAGLEAWDAAERNFLYEKACWERENGGRLLAAQQRWREAFERLEEQRSRWHASFSNLLEEGRREWERRDLAHREAVERVSEELKETIRSESEALHRHVYVLCEAAETEIETMRTAHDAWSYWLDKLDDGWENGSYSSAGKGTSGAAMIAELDSVWEDLDPDDRSSRREMRAEALDWAGVYGEAAARRERAEELCSGMYEQLFGCELPRRHPGGPFEASGGAHKALLSARTVLSFWRGEEEIAGAVCGYAELDPDTRPGEEEIAERVERASARYEKALAHYREVEEWLRNTVADTVDTADTAAKKSAELEGEYNRYEELYAELLASGEDLERARKELATSEALLRYVRCAFLPAPVREYEEARTRREGAEKLVETLEGLLSDGDGTSLWEEDETYRGLMAEYERCYRREVMLGTLGALWSAAVEMQHARCIRADRRVKETAEALSAHPCIIAAPALIEEGGLEEVLEDLHSELEKEEFFDRFRRTWSVDTLEEYCTPGRRDMSPLLRDLLEWSGTCTDSSRLASWAKAELYERWRGGDYGTFDDFLEEEVLSPSYLDTRSDEFDAENYGDQLRKRLRSAHGRYSEDRGYLMYRFLSSLGFSVPHAGDFPGWTAREIFLEAADDDIRAKKKEHGFQAALNYSLAYGYMLVPGMWPVSAAHMALALHFDSLKETDEEELAEIAKRDPGEECDAFTGVFAELCADVSAEGKRKEAADEKLARLLGKGGTTSGGGWRARLFTSLRVVDSLGDRIDTTGVAAAAGLYGSDGFHELAEKVSRMGGEEVRPGAEEAAESTGTEHEKIAAYLRAIASWAQGERQKAGHDLATYVYGEEAEKGLESLQSERIRAYRECFDSYVQSGDDVAGVREAALEAFGGPVFDSKEHVSRLYSICREATADFGAALGQLETAGGGEMLSRHLRFLAGSGDGENDLIGLFVEMRARERAEQLNLFTLRHRAARERWIRQMDAVDSLASREWRIARHRLQRDYRRWKSRAAREYRCGVRSWNAGYAALYSRKAAWTKHADLHAVPPGDGGISESGGEAARAVRDVAGFFPAPGKVRMPETERLETWMTEETAAGLLEAAASLVSADGQSEPKFVSCPRFAPGSRGLLLETRLDRRSFLALQQQRTDCLERKLALIRHTRAADEVRRSEEQLLNRITAANSGFEETMHASMLDSGYRKCGGVYEKELLLGMNLFGGGERERRSIETYRPFTGYREPPEVSRAVQGVSADTTAEHLDDLIEEALSALEEEAVRIFGDADTEEVLVEQEVRCGEETPTWGGLESRTEWITHSRSAARMPGAYGEHIGFAPELKENPDPSAGMEENILFPGSGELGRIAAKLSYHALLEGRGWNEASAAFYDRDMWDDRGTELLGMPVKSLSLRSFTDLAVSAAVAAGSAGAGSFLGMVAANCADDAVFAVADLAGERTEWSEVIDEMSSKVLISGAGHLIGAGTGWLDAQLAESGLLEWAGDLGLEAGRIAADTYSSAALRAVDVSSLGKKGWFSEEEFLAGSAGLGTDLAVGLTGTGVSGGLDITLSGFTGDVYENAAELNRLIGGAAAAGLEYGLEGSTVLNVLDLADFSGGTARHGLLELTLGGEGGGSLSLGSGGADFSAGSLLTAAGGLEAYRENLRMWESGSLHPGLSAPALRTLYSTGTIGMHAEERLYRELLAGETEVREQLDLDAAAKTVMEDGHRVILLGGQRPDEAADDFYLGVLLSHEARRDGIAEDGWEQMRETVSAVLGHSVTAALLADTYGSRVLDEQLRREAEEALRAFSSGDFSVFSEYAAENYAAGEDYWKLVMTGGGRHHIEYDGSKTLTIEYRDTEGTLLGTVRPEGQETESCGWAESLGRVVGVERAEELLGSNIFDATTYDDQTLMDVLGLDAAEAALLREEESFSLEELEISGRQKLRLAGEALLKDSGAYWNARAGEWMNTGNLSLTLADRELEGNILAETDPGGGFNYSMVSAEMSRDPLSYLAYRDGRECLEFFGRDSMTFRRHTLAGELMSEVTMEGLNTVDVTDGSTATGGIGNDQPWDSRLFGTIQGETLRAGDFGLIMDSTGGQWNVPYGLRMCGGETLSGKEIDPFGHAGSNGDRHWFHPTNWGRVDGCFTNFDESRTSREAEREYMELMKTLQTWGVDYGYPIAGTIRDPLEWMYDHGMGRSDR